MYIPKRNVIVARGLYVVTMAIANKPGTHYAILDAGNLLRQFSVTAPTIYHLRPEGLIRTNDLTHVESVEKIDDEVGAITRFQEALARAGLSSADQQL